VEGRNVAEGEEGRKRKNEEGGGRESGKNGKDEEGKWWKGRRTRDVGRWW
jgi:hypothetical protein